jgi:AcrR family transcriptional regulator
LVERREKILAAALDCFVENGYEGTRMQEIASRCGTSYGLVYHYFPTKESIYCALVDVALSSARGAIENFAAGLLSGKEDGQLDSAMAMDDSPKYFLMVVEALVRRGVPAVASERTRAAVLEMERILEVVARGLGKPDRKAWSESVFGVMLGGAVLKGCGLSDSAHKPALSLLLAPESGKTGRSEE